MSMDDGVSYHNIVKKVYKYGYGKRNVLFHIVKDNERVIQFDKEVTFLTNAETWTLQAVIEYFSIIAPVVGILVVGNGYHLTFKTKTEADAVIAVYNIMNNDQTTTSIRKKMPQC